MHGKTWIGHLPNAHNADTTRLFSCRFKLDRLMSLVQRFIDVVSVQNNGTTSKLLIGGRMTKSRYLYMICTGFGH